MHLSTALRVILLSGFAFADPPSWRDASVRVFPVGLDSNSVKGFSSQQCSDTNVKIRQTATVQSTWRDPNDTSASATWWNTYVPSDWGMNVESPWIFYCQASGKHPLYPQEHDFNDFAQNVFCNETGTGKFNRKPNLVMDQNGKFCVPTIAPVEDDEGNVQESACGCKYVQDWKGIFQ